MHLKSTDITKCNFDDLLTSLEHCYRSFDPHGDTVLTELNTSGELSFNEAKSSDDYIEDFLGNQDLTEELLKRVHEKMLEYKDRI